MGRRQRRTAPRSGAASASTRDDAIVVRAFETWIHTDDLRRVAGGTRGARARPRHLALMSDLAGADPAARAGGCAAREHDGKTARLVLTGDGGGDWLVADGRPALPAT